MTPLFSFLMSFTVCIIRVIHVKCYQCRRVFFPRLTLSTLFHQPVSLRCPSCDKRFPVLIHREVLPISNFKIQLCTLFSHETPIKEEAFLDESLKFLLYYLKIAQTDDIFLWIECLEPSLFDCLDQLDLCDIFIISLFPHKLMV